MELFSLPKVYFSLIILTLFFAISSIGFGLMLYVKIKQPKA